MSVLAGVVLLSAAVGTAAAAEHDLTGRAAYERRAPCAADRSTGCVRDVAATVEDTEVEVSRARRETTRTYVVWLRVAHPYGTRGERVEVPEPAVFHTLRPGSEVRARLWDGEVAAVVAGARADETTRSPVVRSARRGTFGLVVLVLGAHLLGRGVEMGRRGGWFVRVAPPGYRGRTAGGTVLRALFALSLAALAAWTMAMAFEVYEPAALAAPYQLAFLTWAGIELVLRLPGTRTARGG